MKRKIKNDAKTARLNLRMEPELFAWLCDEAERQCLSDVSEMVRKLLREAQRYQEQPKPADLVAADMRMRRGGK